MKRLKTRIQEHLEAACYTVVIVGFLYTMGMVYLVPDKGPVAVTGIAFGLVFSALAFVVSFWQFRDARENEWKPARNK